MIITRKITSIILGSFMLLAISTGCSNKSVNPSQERNDIVYSDYSFWERDNQIRITLPIEIDVVEDSDVFYDTGELELPKVYSNRAKFLKQIMISYFNEVYSVDISEKIEKQELRSFEFEGGDGLNETMGYVSENNPNCLNLNNKLFNEYKMYFDNTYIHESLHQIGFISEDSVIITEGIVDAVTDLILCKGNIPSYPTESYNDIRMLGYQILVADKDIAQFYLENENASMLSRISEKLKDIEKTFLDVDPGFRLECLGRALTNGFSATFEPYYIAFEAQEIVRAYCQSFKPDEEIIDYIREHYLVTDYETVIITENEEGYDFFWDE